MLPEHRLAVLLHQVKDQQVNSCKWHTSATSPSLYSDHTCDRELFPNQVLVELEQPGEVWQIRFSHDGTRLAGCGSDDFVYIWDMTTFHLIHKLGIEHGDQSEQSDRGVGNLAWSPDDNLLVSCERNRCACLWDTQVRFPKLSPPTIFLFEATKLMDYWQSGTLLKQLKKVAEPVSSCAWAPDGESFVLASFDKNHAMCTYSSKGEELYTWPKKVRVEDVAISPDGHWLAAMDDQHRIHVYDFASREARYELELQCRGTSVHFSRDSKYLLINKQDGASVLVNISTRATVQTYKGSLGGEFTIRGDFGGADESFAINGSDGKCSLLFAAHEKTLANCSRKNTNRRTRVDLAYAQRPHSRKAGGPQTKV